MSLKASLPTSKVSPDLLKNNRFGPFELVCTSLISALQGEAWKLTEEAIEELPKKYPALLRL